MIEHPLFDAAFTLRDRAAVRAIKRMAEQGTEPVRYVRAQNMFELAGTRFDFHFVADREDIHEEALREAMPADHIARAFLARGRELFLSISDGDQPDAGQRRDQPAPLRPG